MLAMALFLIGSTFLHAPWLYQEKRFHPQLGRYGAAAPLSPASRSGSAGHRASARSSARFSASRGRSSACGPGASLLAVYSIGLGLPFLVAGLALDRAAGRSAG
jgi:cytochrome c biogenesis protein CcdA